MAKKIYDVDGDDLIQQGLSEFLTEFRKQIPEQLKETFESDIMQDLIKLCYSAGFQDGTVIIGQQITKIIKGEIDGPDVNFN